MRSEFSIGLAAVMKPGPLSSSLKQKALLSVHHMQPMALTILFSVDDVLLACEPKAPKAVLPHSGTRRRGSSSLVQLVWHRWCCKREEVVRSDMTHMTMMISKG